MTYTSLGLLNATVVFTATVSPAQSTYYSGSTNPDSSPTPGTTGTVTLVYPYRLPILSNLIPTPAGKSDDRAAGTFSGSATCSVPAGEAFDGQTVSQTSRKPDATYTINVLPQSYSNFKLRAFISADDTNKWEGSWNSGSHLGFNINGDVPTMSINSSGSDLTFSARPTRKFSCTDLLTGVTEQYLRV